MRAYILTGTPGSGKTAILRQLEIDGYAVVEEAATDVIALQQALGQAQPWREPGFAGRVLDLQRRRRLASQAAATTSVVFVDRSPICTLALCRYLELAEPPGLAGEIESTVAGGWYARPAFFVRHQGFIQTTQARRISLQDALAFEKVHELTYREVGFEVVDIEPAALALRVAAIRQALG